MKIAIVGSGLTGLSAAQLLSEDPRHVTTVFETRARFGGAVDECLVAECLDRLARLGVALRRTAQVERLAADETGADLWLNGRSERFDLALVAASSADAWALLARSGLPRQVGSAPLRTRVYFTEHGIVDPNAAARSVLAQMAVDHPALGPRPCSRLPLRPAQALRSLARQVDASTAAHVEYVDLSGGTWPLGVPAIYIADQRWLLDAVVPRRLTARSPWRPSPYVTATTTVGKLEAGASVAFVVEGRPAGREGAADALQARAAAFAALAVNAPIVPIAARDRPATPSGKRFGHSRPQVRVVLGEPFYAETSSIDELMDDMRVVMRHLERCASRPPKRLHAGD